MSVPELLQSRRDDIYRVARRHGVSRIRVYGNGDGDDNERSNDIYFLVDANDGVSPWFPASLIVDLEDLLDRPGQIHVAEEDSLNERLRRDVLAEAAEL